MSITATILTILSLAWLVSLTVFFVWSRRTHNTGNPFAPIVIFQMLATAAAALMLGWMIILTFWLAAHLHWA